MKVDFYEEEIELLKIVLSKVVIQQRTGSIGIIHGQDRFVSTNISLRKWHQKSLVSAYKKLGLNDYPKSI